MLSPENRKEYSLSSKELNNLMLEAQKDAYGDGLEFLISKGAAEPQAPGHVRWVEYDHLGEIVPIVNDFLADVQCMVARKHVRNKLPEIWDIQRFGSTQRPPLDWKPDGVDTIDFLCGF